MAEIELKLAFDDANLPALRRALTRAASGKPGRKLLRATYYDTGDLALHRRDFTLRVRQENKAFVQTVKRAKPSLTKRGEWSDTLTKAEPDLGTKSGRRIRKLIRGALKPQFTVDVERAVFNLRPARGSAIEAVIDQGTIRGLRGGRGQDRIGEIELELKAGTASAIYDTALKLAKSAPLTIETRAKSTRGYALAVHRTPEVVKARTIDVTPKMTLEDILRDGGRTLLTQYLRNIPAMMQDETEAIHQMRVALRRLRGLLKALTPALSDPARDWADGRAKHLLKALGPAREWDVFAQEMVAPLTRKKKEPPVPASGAFQRAVQMAGMQARRAARNAVGAPDHTVTVLELLSWFERRGWRQAGADSGVLAQPAKKCAGAILDRQLKRARKRSRQFTKLSAEDRHKFRIALKDLRYTVELFAPLLPRRRAAAYIRRVKPIQEVLGHLNDMTTAHRLLAELTAAHPDSAVTTDGGIVVGWYERRATAADRRLCKDVENLRTAKPPWH